MISSRLLFQRTQNTVLKKHHQIPIVTSRTISSSYNIKVNHKNRDNTNDNNKSYYIYQCNYSTSINCYNDAITTAATTIPSTVTSSRHQQQHQQQSSCVMNDTSSEIKGDTNALDISSSKIPTIEKTNEVVHDDVTTKTKIINNNESNTTSVTSIIEDPSSALKKKLEEENLVKLLQNNQRNAFNIENLTNLSSSQLYSISTKILSLSNKVTLTPSFVINTIQPVLRVCSQRQGYEKYCEQLLGKCIIQSKELSLEYGEPIPTKEMYTNVIHAWSKCYNLYGANRSLQILNMMYDEYQKALKKNNNDDEKKVEEEDFNRMVLKPDAFHYATVMSAFINASDDVSNAIQKVEDVLNLMIKKHKIQPDIVCYNTLLTAHARYPNRYTIAKCEDIFKHIQYLYKKQQEEKDDDGHTTSVSMKPTKQTYSAIIHAYSKSIKASLKSKQYILSDKQKQIAADRCEELLNELIDIYQEDPIGNNKLAPDRILLNTVLSTVAKSGNPTRAEALLERMYSLSSMLTSTKQANLHYDDQASLSLIPDRISYNTVIDGYAKIKNKEEHILKLITTMEELHTTSYHHNDSYSIKPNTSTYNAYMYSHITSKSTNFAFKISNILQTMCDNPTLKPNIISYGTVLYAWSLHPNRKEAYDQSMKIYNDMLHKYTTLNDYDARPNDRCYQNIIGIVCKNDDLDLALKLLHDMNTSNNNENTIYEIH